MTHEEIIIKWPRQIEWIRKASKLVANTLKMIEEYVKPGVTTEELDHLCNLYIKKNWWKSASIGYMGYPKYTCISLNDVICHWIPSKNTILKDWDILNIDITVVMNWYFWDASSMYTVWEISNTAKKLIEVTKKCLDIWIAQVRPWNRSWNIWFEISKYAEKNWFSVVREYTWHWVWLFLHEEPYIFHKAEKWSWVDLKPGMVFTIEPMINEKWYKTILLKDDWTVKTADWWLSAQFEHTILVTEKWYEILTLPD